jgi:hypothetical protein
MADGSDVKLEARPPRAGTIDGMPPRTTTTYHNTRPCRRKPRRFHRGIRVERASFGQFEVRDTCSERRPFAPTLPHFIKPAPRYRVPDGPGLTTRHNPPDLPGQFEVRGRIGGRKQEPHSGPNIGQFEVRPGQFEVRNRAVWGPGSGSLRSGVGQFEVRNRAV